MPTGISWTQETWNPVHGCDRVSDGCTNCYALTMAKRLKGMGQPTYQQDGNPATSGPGFAVTLAPHLLTQPLRWKNPRRIFVDSMGDLFHDAVPDAYIAKVWAVMAQTRNHTYQLLTKRHGRMRSLLTSSAFRLLCEEAEADLMADEASPIPGYKRRAHQKRWWSRFSEPLPNLWLGVSVEDQKTADLRIPALLDTPAAVRWISAEPLLGPIDLHGTIVPGRGRPTLTYWLTGRPHWVADEPGSQYATPGGTTSHIETGPHLDWVVVGGESGPRARPMHPQWAQTIHQQCRDSNIPFHFKQWGEWTPMWPLNKDGSVNNDAPRYALANDGTLYQAADLAYPDGARWGEALRAGHQRAHLTAMYRSGTRNTGRSLYHDDHTHDEYPRKPGG